MKKLFSICIFISLISLKLFSGAGTVSGQYLKLEADSRAAALGGAYSSVTGEAMSLLYNPSGILFSKTKNISLLYSTYLDDMNYQTGAFSMPFGKFGFGAGVSMFSYGKFTGYKQDGIEKVDVGSSGSLTIAGGAGYQITDKIGFGVGIKSVSETLDTKSTSGIVFDAGLVFKTEKVSIGASIQNLAGKLQFDKAEENLPQIIRLGVSGNPINNLQILFDVKNTDSGIGAGLGIEYSPLSLLSVRAGYNYVSKMSGLTGLTGITAGIGININKFGLDIAYAPTGELGNAIRAALSFKFGETNSTGKSSLNSNINSSSESAGKNISSEKSKVRKPVEKETVEKRTDIKESSEIKAEAVKEEKSVLSQEANGKSAVSEKTITEEKAIKKTMPIEEKKKTFMKALALYKAGEYKKAIIEWQKILEVDPTHTSSLEYIKKANDNLIKK